MIAVHLEMHVFGGVFSVLWGWAVAAMAIALVHVGGSSTRWERIGR